MNLQMLFQHRQLYPMSCIPMAVELVLKFLNRVPPDFVELQTAWKNDSGGSFGRFNGSVISGIRFHRPEGFDERNDRFPFDRLFATIDDELCASRCVIISLASNGGWHMYVIIGRAFDDEYVAVSRSYQPDAPAIIANVKEAVRAMRGTDILTYTFEAIDPANQ